MKQPNTNRSIPDAVTLSAELDSVAAELNLCYVILKEWDSLERRFDQPSAGQLAEVLYGAEQHLLRISEDWLIHTELLEDRVKAMIKTQSSDQERKEADNETA